jgi:hypothetical protein
LDLNRILHVFQVDTVFSLLISLIVCLQTELAINAHVAISDLGQGVSDTHVVVSDTHVVVSDTHAVVSDSHAILSDTHAVVSDIRCTIARDQERVDDSNRSVSFAFYSHFDSTKPSPLYRLEPGSYFNPP